MTPTKTPSNTKQAVAAGATIGTAVLLGVVGVLAVFQGLAAILSGPSFVIGFEYVFKIDPNGWGWIHLDPRASERSRWQSGCSSEKNWGDRRGHRDRRSVHRAQLLVAARTTRGGRSS